MKCRHCHKPLEHVFLDLGFAPPSNAYLNQPDLLKPELYFPLKVYVCGHCWLVQTADYKRPEELFCSDYAYFSSTSITWLNHAARYADMICQRLDLNKNSYVVEIASNDGYLLKNFVDKKIPCLGIEPTQQTADAAEVKGIPVCKEFFGSRVAERIAAEGRLADLIIGNNVYAHIPDINDFTMGLKKLLKPSGTVTLEYQYVLRLIENSQFDTIYHEHFSYHSLTTVVNIFKAYDLMVFDVEELPTHGGSLRVYGCHQNDHCEESTSVTQLLEEENQKGLYSLDTYTAFQNWANKIKDALLSFLIEQKRAGKSVAAYGAAAKGNTLLNYAGVKIDLLPYVCDAAPAKQGRFLPGSRIPIVNEEEIRRQKPEYIIILPWNIKGEIMDQLSYVREWGGKFVTAVPELRIIEEM